jgi:hypothetical protein
LPRFHEDFGCVRGSDSELHFKIQWKTAIPNGSKLLFQVTKTDPKDTKKTSAVKSMDYPFAVNYVEKPAAAGSEKNDQDSDQKGKDTDKNEKDSDKKAKAKDGEKKAKTGSN